MVVVLCSARLRGAIALLFACHGGGCGRLGFEALEHDASVSELDASTDAGTPDAGTPDAGTPDAGTPDAGTPDAGTPDAGTPDAGTPDAADDAMAASVDAADLDALGLDADLDAAPLDASAPRPNYAFVTEGRVTGALGGVSGADAVCNAEAIAAGLRGDFVAMLRATDRPSPAALLAGSRGWVLADGEWVADLPAQVEDGSFFRPIHTTARGTRVDGTGGGYRVWTGDNGNTCADWSSDSALGDQHWIPQWRRLSDGELPCSDAYRLFCFERGHEVAAVRPAITRPRIFVTRGLWAPNAMGIDSADALCAAEATMAGLGPSRALLPTATEAALDRTGHRTYQRVDGFPIGIPGNELTQHGYVVLDATGATPIDMIGLWTGGDADTPSPNACGDWTSSTGDGQEGPAADWPGFDGYLRPCSGERHLYCVER